MADKVARSPRWPRRSPAGRRGCGAGQSAPRCWRRTTCRAAWSTSSRNCRGIAGRHYATHAGEPAEVALAIDEAYQPRFAGDDIALSGVGKVLAIAERLDTLAGGFAAGSNRPATRDPFALRRNALGLAHDHRAGSELTFLTCWTRPSVFGLAICSRRG